MTDKQIIIKLNKDLLDIHFTEGQIKAFMREYNFNYIQSVLYLWFYNNVSISPKDLKTDTGRPMYREFAESVKDLFEVTNYDR